MPERQRRPIRGGMAVIAFPWSNKMPGALAGGGGAVVAGGARLSDVGVVEISRFPCVRGVATIAF